MKTTPTPKSLKELVSEDTYLGSIVDLNYDSALILTSDFQQETVGGLPRNAFLTAAVLSPEKEVKEVILLSVQSPEQLVMSRQLIEVKEGLADLQMQTGEDSTLDPQTQAKLSLLGFRCNVLGTFYADSENRIKFGADLSRVRGNSLLKVFKPRGRALSLIGSFSNSLSVDSSGFLEIGKVRYSDTDPEPDLEAGAFINIKDFIGKKTALFGMSRSGKSNSMKTIIQKVHFYSRSLNQPIAQLIFDPQGEFSNTNSQDGEALANIGDENEVSVYKIMDKSMSPKERYLQFDLFKIENLALTWQLILGEVSSGISADANYISDIFNVDFEPLGEGATIPQKVHFERKKLALYALMYEGVRNYPVPRFTISIGDPELAESIGNSKNSDGVKVSETNSGELVITSTLGASKVAIALLREKDSTESRLSDSWVREIEDNDGGILLNQITEIREKGRNGVKAAISRILDLHSPHAVGDVRKNVWEDIQAGKLIVVDLSRGSTKTSQVLSELIVNYLLEQASNRFVSSLPPVPFQIVVEEAHNLFERDGKQDDRDPWVRISKEAAKYHIGLLYATQEVSSVDRRILSNSANWIISHLNSNLETAELSKYYQFADWADSIKRIETKGFVRMKTESSPYIVPIQIELFKANVKNPSLEGSKLESISDKSNDSDTDVFEF